MKSTSLLERAFLSEMRCEDELFCVKHLWMFVNPMFIAKHDFDLLTLGGVMSRLI